MRAGEGIATGRIGPKTRLKIVDAIVSGVHAPGESHFELLRAFADDAALDAPWPPPPTAHGYRNHEFGDSVLIERSVRARRGDALALHRQPHAHAARGRYGALTTPMIGP